MYIYIYINHRLIIIASIFLFPDLIPYKTPFDYFQIVCLVYSYLLVADTF